MAAKFSDLPPLRETIAKYNLLAKKALGQHFLCDLTLTRIIAECAGDLSGKNVFEIGPGPGGLTRALLETSATKIIAIEKDARCVAALQELVQIAGDKLTILENDALKTDLTRLALSPRAIVANLPYNIGSELLIHWLHAMPAFDSMTLMFQAEVVDRLIAEPDSKTYGRLSVITQFCCDAERMLDIPAAAFTPPPKVNSSVVHLTPRKTRPADIQLKVLEKVTAAAFGKRRKMLRSSLKPLGGEALLKEADIDPTRRAETLSIAEFESLTRIVQHKRLLS